MKKILLFVILCLCFIGKVNAQDITLDKFVNVVNNGEVTRSFINSLPKNSVGSINAIKNSDTNIRIDCSFTIPNYDKDGNVSYSTEQFGIDFVYDLNTNVLQGEKSYDTKTDEYISPYILSVLKLVPYWTVESSSKFENIKGYLGNDDIIDTFSKIFDKCYFDKMGVCYTEVTKFTNITYLTKVELTDKGADYAIDYFKQVEKDKDESEFSSFLVKILIGLVAAIIIVYLLRGIILSITKQ